MNGLAVNLYVHFLVDGDLEELDEAAVGALIATGDTAMCCRGHALSTVLYACGQRWITTLERLGRTWEVDQLQPYAVAAQAALAATRLA
jgi:hypothetical protein